MPISGALGKRLVEASGLTSDRGLRRSRLLVETAFALGQYQMRVRAHDEAPRPSSRLLMLERLERLADELRTAIDEIDPDTVAAMTFAKPAASPAELRRYLSEFLDGITHAQQAAEQQGTESRGAAPRYARRLTVNEIAVAFCRATGNDGSVDQGDLIEYLQVACDAAGITLPDTPAKILDLLSDSIKERLAVP